MVSVLCCKHPPCSGCSSRRALYGGVAAPRIRSWWARSISAGVANRTSPCYQWVFMNHRIVLWCSADAPYVIAAAAERPGQQPAKLFVNPASHAPRVFSFVNPFAWQVCSAQPFRILLRLAATRRSNHSIPEPAADLLVLSLMTIPAAVWLAPAAACWRHPCAQISTLSYGHSDTHLSVWSLPLLLVFHFPQASPDPAASWAISRRPSLTRVPLAPSISYAVLLCLMS